MIYISPASIKNRSTDKKSIFLAGSIEMNKAIDWQRNCECQLEEKYHVFNPRRRDWDSTGAATKDNPVFKEQVDWELDALDAANHILLYFVPNTKSPISLLELGLYAASGKLLVICPEGFWRKGNVDIVCERYGIPLLPTLDAALEYFKNS